MTIDEINKCLSSGRIFTTVKLPLHLESAFRDYERDHRRRESVFGLALGTFFYIAVLVLDRVVAPDVFVQDVLTRFCVGLPINLAMIWLVARPACGDAVRQAAGCIAGLTCCLTVTSVMIQSVSPGAAIYFSGNLIILGFTINLVALHTPVAVLVCCGITVIMIAGAALSPLGHPAMVVCYTLVGVLQTVVCVFANWCLQNERRRTFLTLQRDKIRLRQISQQRDLLEQLAAIDPLTGLANRRGFDAMVDADLNRAEVGTPVCVAMIDIDCFKAFNDSYGHPRGDAVLRAVADAMAVRCEPGQRLGRLGGEEFAVAAVGTDHAALPALGERLRRAVEARALPHGRGGAGPVVTISVGLAGSWTTGSVLDTGRFFALADEALYQAKRAGRNRAVVTVEEPPKASDGLRLAS
ncbi:GGDEF domain-containing protein [Methylobacterium radiodurans]|uniref:GGDEF domain-containing protein n=1 Tax=Methylobacterium radiodurans TaxID=2202828 RepID=UPI0013A57B74|nr:GGDEF domain-containing protein [Methylobacterium radiodurans]